jgi:hypothetical protein
MGVGGLLFLLLLGVFTASGVIDINQSLPAPTSNAIEVKLGRRHL